MAVFLAWAGAELDDLDGGEGPWVELRVVGPGLAMVESEETRSIVYHALKWSLPPGTPVLVTALEEVPKAKGLRRGTRPWLEGRLGA